MLKVRILSSVLWCAIHICAATLSQDRNQIQATLHVPAKLSQLQTEAYGQADFGSGVVAERVSFISDYDLRVPALVYRSASDEKKKRPALIVVNGYGADKSSWYAYWAGMLYARAGAVVLTYDALGEFERNKLRMSGARQHDTPISADEMALRLSGLMVSDVEQAVSYLRSRRDVDRKRIAVLGFSSGSFITALTCALDTRIRACVLTGGGNLDGPGQGNNSSPRDERIAYKSLEFLGDRGAAICALNAKGGATFIYNGTEDSVAGTQNDNAQWFSSLQRRVVARAGSRNVFEFAFEPGGGHRPYFLTRPVALWLEEQLDLPNWTAAQIESMPSTPIAAWALQNGTVASITPEFAHDEGGTSALGLPLPYPPRSRFNAVPEAIWSSQRRQFIYETWVVRVRAAIRSGAP